MLGWLAFGDSHVGAIEEACRRGLLDRPCEVLQVGGATAVGLRNPNSLTNAMETFSTRLLGRRGDLIPVMHLGEVDCGFVIWWRAKAHGESVQTQLDESLNAHICFADRLLAGGYETVVLTGATLPTIPEGHEWGDVANFRRELKVGLRQRTDLTLRYNDALRRAAADRGMPFVDLTPQLIDVSTGVVSDYYLNPDPGNHHLHPARAAQLWAEALNGLKF